MKVLARAALRGLRQRFQLNCRYVRYMCVTKIIFDVLGAMHGKATTVFYAMTYSADYCQRAV